MSYCPIGFHVGPGGNRQGIGDYFRRLDAAGRPAILKSADDYGACRELAALRQTSGVPHVIVFRKSGGAFELPNYALPPDQAAGEHWPRIVDSLPPEFHANNDKDHVWLEVINEPDKGRAEWLGQFMFHTAQLALAGGYKLCGPAWSSGEPEPEHWRVGWFDYLRLCAQHPMQLGIALHEYSYNSNDILSGGGSLVGRFQRLFDTCDAEEIARPSLIMTEFGWNASEVPGDVDVAMSHLRQAAALYRQHPQILGAAIWYLGAKYGGIANQAQRLIRPLTDYALSDEWDNQLPERKPPPPPTKDRGQPRQPYRRVYQVLHPSATSEQALAVFRSGLDSRLTTGWSFDDAGIGDLDDRTALVFGCPAAEEQSIRDFYQEHYPGVKVEFRPLPGG